jgi:hypothetical protein
MRLDRPTRHAKHREARRRRVLTQGIASITQGIADALVCKDLGPIAARAQKEVTVIAPVR